MEIKTVIIADMEASRKMTSTERYKWQLFVKSSLIQINEAFASEIEAPFMITKGDEFQGVLKDISTVQQLLTRFERLVFPLRMRYGIGRGEIHKMGSNIPIEMDGPGFHRASAALKTSKKKKCPVCIETEDPAFDITVNAIYKLIFAIKRRWSEVSYKRYWNYVELGTYERVAREEGVSPQAIWDSLRNSNAMDIRDAEQALDTIFLSHKL